MPPPEPATWKTWVGQPTDKRERHEQQQQAPHQRRNEGTKCGRKRWDRPLGTRQEMVGLPGGKGWGFANCRTASLFPRTVGGADVHLCLSPGPESTCQLPGDSNPHDCLPSTLVRPLAVLGGQGPALALKQGNNQRHFAVVLRRNCRNL